MTSLCTPREPLTPSCPALLRVGNKNNVVVRYVNKRGVYVVVNDVFVVVLLLSL